MISTADVDPAIILQRFMELDSFGDDEKTAAQVSIHEWPLSVTKSVDYLREKSARIEGPKSGMRRPIRAAVVCKHVRILVCLFLTCQPSAVCRRGKYLQGIADRESVGFNSLNSEPCADDLVQELHALVSAHMAGPLVRSVPAIWMCRR